MSVSQHTLNNLYNQGILDYVPYDLINGPVTAYPNGGFNPYLQCAMQGHLYQNHGNTADSFSSTNGAVSTETAGVNGFGAVNGNVFMNNPQAGINGFGGGFGKVGEAVNRTPNLVKGLLSGALIFGTLYLCLKGKKKAPANTTQEGFLSKLKFWKKNK